LRISTQLPRLVSSRIDVPLLTHDARSFPPSLIEGSVRPEQFEVLPLGRGPHARSGSGHSTREAAHSERFGAPAREAAGSAGMDAPRDDRRNINTSGAQWVEQPKA
jgi:hypothetical protein